MDDVFDVTGNPPQGWMHAIFNGGPYGEDVGRCIPGPPAPATIEVPWPDGRRHVYRLWSVASWSDPTDPIAVYNDTGPVAQPPLSEQEQEWIRRRTDR